MYIHVVLYIYNYTRMCICVNSHVIKSTTLHNSQMCTKSIVALYVPHQGSGDRCEDKASGVIPQVSSLGIQQWSNDAATAMFGISIDIYVFVRIVSLSQNKPGAAYCRTHNRSTQPLHCVSSSPSSDAVIGNLEPASQKV